MEIISKLSDLPNDTDGLTAAELKARFDRAGTLLKAYINGTLLAELSGSGAAVFGLFTAPVDELSLKTRLYNCDRFVCKLKG